MITKTAAGALAMAAMLALATVPAGATATITAATPGAKPVDRMMTCTDVAAERTAVNDAVAKEGAKKQSAAKVKKGLFGFAKTFAGLAIPGAGAVISGSSMLGSIAAQSAGQTASRAINSASEGAAPLIEAKSDAEQQARLVRLEKIDTYRQCGA